MCKHKNTQVVNSSRGATDRIKKAHYESYMLRTRKCHDCGKNIQTVEIERDEFEKILPYNLKYEILKDFMEFLEANDVVDK